METHLRMHYEYIRTVLRVIISWLGNNLITLVVENKQRDFLRLIANSISACFYAFANNVIPRLPIAFANAIRGRCSSCYF